MRTKDTHAARRNEIDDYFVDSTSQRLNWAPRSVAAAILGPGQARSDGRYYDQDDVDDVVLDAWLATRRSAKAQVIAGRPVLYAKQVIRNKAISRLRGRHQRWPDSLDRPVDDGRATLGELIVGDGEWDADDAVWASATGFVLAEARAALASAPLSLRAFETYLACHLDAAWTYDVIVSRDGCRRPTARQRLTEARNRLRDQGVLAP